MGPVNQYTNYGVPKLSYVGLKLLHGQGFNNNVTFTFDLLIPTSTEIIYRFI